jgi:hypothetical protein
MAPLERTGAFTLACANVLPPLPLWRWRLGIWCGCWCSEWGAIDSASNSFLFRFRFPTLARAFTAQAMQKAKIVCLAIVTTLARLRL